MPLRRSVDLVPLAAALVALLDVAAADALMLSSGDVLAISNDQVVRVDPATGATDLIATVPAARDLVVDARKRIFVLSISNGAHIVEVDPVTGVSQQVADYAARTGDYKIDVGADGRLVVSTGTALLSIDPDTGAQTSVPYPPDPIDPPASTSWLGFVAALPDGRAIVARTRDDLSIIQPVLREFFAIDPLSGALSPFHSEAWYFPGESAGPVLTISDLEVDPATGTVYESGVFLTAFSIGPSPVIGAIPHGAGVPSQGGVVQSDLPMAVDLNGDVLFGCQPAPPAPDVVPPDWCTSLVRWDPDTGDVTGLPVHTRIDELAVVPVPEPASALLVLMGLGLLAAPRGFRSPEP